MAEFISEQVINYLIKTVQTGSPERKITRQEAVEIINDAKKIIDNQKASAEQASRATKIYEMVKKINRQENIEKQKTSWQYMMDCAGETSAKLILKNEVVSVSELQIGKQKHKKNNEK